jgi:hypothetical protein
LAGRDLERERLAGGRVAVEGLVMPGRALRDADASDWLPVPVPLVALIVRVEVPLGIGRR